MCQHKLGAIDEAKRFFGTELQRLPIVLGQPLLTRNFTMLGVTQKAFSDEWKHHLRKGREVAGGAERSLLRYHGIPLLVVHGR